MADCCRLEITAFCRIAAARSYQYRLRRFFDAIRDGATLIAHPDTIDELRTAGLRNDTLRPLAFSGKVIPSQYVPKGTLLAAPIPTRTEIIKRIGTPDFSQDWVVR